MNVQNEKSSDLQRARQLSRRLASPATEQGIGEPPQGFVRFRGFAPPKPTTPRRPTLAPGDPTPRSSPMDPVPFSAPAANHEMLPWINPELVGSWEQFLAWCSLHGSIESAFVVDGQGFVIGQHGQLLPEEFDGVGAELSLAMEQLARIEALRGELGSAVLAFGTRTLIGFRAKVASEELVLGLVATDPIPQSVMAAVGAGFRAVLPKLA